MNYPSLSEAYYGKGHLEKMSKPKSVPRPINYRDPNYADLRDKALTLFPTTLKAGRSKIYELHETLRSPQTALHPHTKMTGSEQAESPISHRS